MATEAQWRFPRSFWIGNIATLFERGAYYGVFIGLVVYLTRNYGFSDVAAGWIGAYFSSFIYLVPTLAGAWADRMGFRAALMLAFGLLAAGYFLLGLFGLAGVQVTVSRSAAQIAAVAALTLILLGGAFVKPVISGTVARASDAASRARAFSIYYQVVNIGSFLGKIFAQPLREHLGLEHVSFYSAFMAFLGFALVACFYRGQATGGEHKSVRQILSDFKVVLSNTRFMALILIVAGFWAIQGQVYATMPKYVLRTVGESAKPEWLANINPAVVVVLVVPVTHLVRKLKPVTSIGIAMLLIPLSALAVASSPLLRSKFGSDIGFAGISFHPVTVALILGIGLQGLAECFLSPRYLEFASKQAPAGQEGLYMGYSNLKTFVAWLLGFAMSGYLLDAFCPDPRTLSDASRAAYQRALASGGELPPEYARAHYIWFVYAGIGLLAFVALLVFRWVTGRRDRLRRPQEEPVAAPGRSTDERRESAPEASTPPAVDPLGLNPAILHVVVLVKIAAFVVVLNLVQGTASALVSPDSWSFYLVVYLAAAASANLVGMWAARAGWRRLAAGLWRATGLVTLPLGLYLFVSARLLREGSR